MANPRRPVRAAMSLLAVVLGLLGVGLLTAGPAGAQTVNQVASGLLATPVYNDPAAEHALTTDQATQLRQQIESGSVPIYVAVLPQEFQAGNGGTADAATRRLAVAVGKQGVYATVIGNAFRAASTQGTVKDLADQAFADNSANGVYAVLTAFVASVQQRFGSGGSAGSGSSSSSSPWIPLGLMGIVVAGGGYLGYRGVRAARRAGERQLAEVRESVQEDITELGERLGSFHSDDPRMTEEARADLTAGLAAYDQAKAAADGMRSPHDVGTVTSSLEDGRYALACAQARLEGQPVPARRPPCFLDPRHGPSTQDVLWAPPGGVPREVPVCAACATTIASGAMPASREVLANGQRVPYWNAGAAYANYAGGYYQSYGGMLPGLLMGTMLGSMMGGGNTYVNVDSNAAGGFGGGDFGGGFGGGDFGGGGFGGGDFGGGDMGGGSF